ncbi:TM2 domain-containing protein [Ruficoccus sp. ZRK36]|uniref:TM2 domain-containing protein n=1 Tax=Ruficoccus sp. ZRK36 TaxID=2866311 RepID=UPI001C735F3A|nr:TM2 domain-containing protein [Ruficoccus sp. ZRK36]QYY34679.1 TM2 domain-containing protein [Ruficoccus sp. ZRK36]
MSEPALPPRLTSPKDHATALALCVTLGSFGVHRYYVGRMISGTLQLLSTLVCCAAGIGYGWAAYKEGNLILALFCILAMMVLIAIWPLMDFVLLNKNRFVDNQGRPLLVA